MTIDVDRLAIDAGWLVYLTGECNRGACNSMPGVGHEPSCGMEGLATLEDVVRMLETHEAMTKALTLIGTECSRYTGPSTCVEDIGLSPFVDYTADRWCDGCIARVGLAGGPFPADETEVSS